MADYGYDMYCDTDISPTLQDIGSPAIMPQVALRRLYTPLGSLLSAPSIVTCDVREFLSSDVALDGRQIARIKSTVTSALIDDARIDQVTVVPRYDERARSLVLGITGFGAGGPFRLTIAATAATVQLLSNA